jgi:capsular polysaccharide transport system permease protein
VGDVQRYLDLHALFTKPEIDYLSRLAPSATIEEVGKYWNSMVWAHFDLISGNVTVAVRAFAPQESLKLAETVIKTSDAMFEGLNEKVQKAFVRIADQNVRIALEKLATARKELATFREESGLVALDQTALAGSAIFDDLRKQLANLQAQYTSMKANSPASPNLAVLKSQITAVENQIRNSIKPGTTPVKAVSPDALAKWETLDLERQVAEKSYGDALTLRMQAYMTAQGLQSYLALIVKPTLAQTSLYPDRAKSIAVVALIAAAVWFVGMLIAYAIRDHLA